jgi:cytochrome c2
MKRTLFLLMFAVACNRAETPAPAPAKPAATRIVAGDPVRGGQLVPQYACNACHVIPNTTGPQGSLAPSLAGVASRPMISNGMVQNTPENLRKFIQNPSSVNPQSSMPPIGLPDMDAQDITAFLMTLK